MLSPYDDSTPVVGTSLGVYIALSGNTCAGKSGLVEAVCDGAGRLGLPAIGISERLFHHPYLQLMFSRPERYAFPIQLSFMLERHMVLLRNLELARTVIIERSHFDDRMFLEEHRQANRISTAQVTAYDELARVLHARLPAPDVLVLMNPHPEVSLARLALAEQRGERPREFPSEATKEAWVLAWHRQYESLHDEFRRRRATDPAFAKTTLIEAGPEPALDALTAAILERIEERVGDGDLELIRRGPA